MPKRADPAARREAVQGVLDNANSGDVSAAGWKCTLLGIRKGNRTPGCAYETDTARWEWNAAVDFSWAKPDTPTETVQLLLRNIMQKSRNAHVPLPAAVLRDARMRTARPEINQIRYPFKKEFPFKLIILHFLAGT